MRIALVLHCFDPLRGGAEHWTWQLARGLLKRGHEVHVLACSFAPPAFELPIVPHRVAGRGGPDDFAAAVAPLLAEESFDVVHDMGVGWQCDLFQPHSGCMESLFARNLVRWPLALRPLKVAIDTLSPRKWRHRRLARLRYRHGGPLLVAISEFIARDLQERYAVESERIRVVGNGVDSDRFAPAANHEQRDRTRAALGLRSGELVGVFLAKNPRLKGIQPLLRALATATRRGSDMRIMIVGGRRYAAWKSYARFLGVGDRVLWIEPTAETAPLYAAADFLVHPTYYDACSLVVLEGAAAGLPIITTREKNGVAEQLEHGRNALLIDSATNHAALAEALEQMSHQPLRSALGAAARQFALAHTFDHNVEQILGVYREIAARKAAGAAVPERRAA